MLQLHENHHNVSDVDSFLPFDSEEKKHEEVDENQENSTEVEDELEGDEDPALIKTKHDFVTSPWSRLGIIGGAFGVGFLLVFLVLNGMMNGSKTGLKPEATPTPSPTTTPSEQKDGDVYAKLALAKQQEELDTLNGKKDEKESKAEAKIQPTKAETRPTQQKVVTQETPPPRRRVYREPAAEPELKPRRREIASQPIPPLRPTAPVSKIPRVSHSNLTHSLLTKAVNNNQNQTVAKNPLAELERLRSVGNVGQVKYALTAFPSTTESTSTSTKEVTATTGEIRSTAEVNTTRSRRRSRRNESTDTTNNNTIEELRPRWKPTIESNSPKYADNEESSQAVNVSYDYLSEEAQILYERKPQYLVVGSFANATLVTPLVLPQTSHNNNNRSQAQTNTLRFVAQLDEPLYSNTGEIAIPRGTQVTITMLAVDDSSGVYAEVTTILKDGTEYPVSPGTISVLGEAGSPLIARPYKDKGPEIAKYDATLGTIAGIAKIGEIINKSEEVTEDLPLGGTRTRTRNNKRSIEGAFVQGFFGKLSDTVSKRTERATEEINRRPNVWYVPKNTKITIRVDRSLKL
ncbi:hypothetical protein DP113_33965 (plasmid) [Brasilonema octagenarum UFV-E1]|uniref:Uncharacterized protein n=2 Tax=Brasilonema TaxID=383614 RepID=A0A856MQ94_9CYAN|nr:MULTISPECIES: TrbI/VirB10 family protein [Brasilonema]NMF66790.1 hypothetical protein [Brasilonema octagenarum UFV-OR1]QDL12739.1 hypothetical protein DP114_33855 [Brasilonema sennae CENA114]QDL19135.1 hypothetical protein DP113_33965 [Brasilonema octagenarum UFV-E1]